MTLYTRQLAWLHTAPEKAEGDRSTERELTRFKAMERDGVKPVLPPCDLPYMIDYLLEIGPVLPSTSGAGPITHAEIASWQRNTGIRLSAWESRTLRRLSSDYLGESNAATARDRPSPYQTEETIAINRQAAVAAFRAARQNGRTHRG